MATHQQVRNTDKPSFGQWLRSQHLDDWARLLASAEPEIAAMATATGIDWQALRHRLPTPGTLLKGAHVPSLSPRDQGRNAFVWQQRDDRYGRCWPQLVFMSFRHGGLHHIFHGYRWAWLKYQQTTAAIIVPEHSLPTLDTRDTGQSEAQRQRWRAENFLRENRSWQNAAPAGTDHPLLQRRLSGHADAALLSRIALRHVAHRDEGYLAVRLLHREHGHCGFQHLHARPLDAQGRTQHLVIRASGMKRGALVVIRASAGHENWPVAICEGVFTALSVALAWPGPLAIALDAGNLSAVRNTIQRSCVFFADHDAWGPYNTGLRRAEQARQPGDRIALPAFEAGSRALQPTDYNDLLQLAGIDELQRQVRAHWPARG